MKSGGVVGGGGALHSSSSTGLTQAGRPPDGAVQVDVAGAAAGAGVVDGAAAGGVGELDNLSATDCTPLRDITPPMPPTISSTTSLSILANAWSSGARLLIGCTTKAKL